MIRNMASLLLLASVLATLLATGSCQGTCGTNEEYTTCGSKCPKTCDDVANMKRETSCASVCIPGCFCKQGYVLNNGSCVEESTCPCHPHAHYECGSMCPITCNNYQNPPEVCTMDCMMGCHCEEGYVRSGESGKCVLPGECPKKV